MCRLLYSTGARARQRSGGCPAGGGRPPRPLRPRPDPLPRARAFPPARNARNARTAQRPESRAVAGFPACCAHAAASPRHRAGRSIGIVQVDIRRVVVGQLVLIVEIQRHGIGRNRHAHSL